MSLRPPRCVLVDVATGESLECLFNPTQLKDWNVEFDLDCFFATEWPASH